MIDFVETIAYKFPELSCQMNKGERLRIMKDGWYGSLWATYKKRTDKYHFELTGDLGIILANKIVPLYGKYKKETRGYKYWNLNRSDVEKIIKIYTHTV